MGTDTDLDIDVQPYRSAREVWRKHFRRLPPKSNMALQLIADGWLVDSDYLDYNEFCRHWAIEFLRVNKWRRYLRRQLFTRFRFNAQTETFMGEALEITKRSSASQIEQYQQAKTTMQQYALLESLYNAMKNGQDEAMDRHEDGFLGMYDAVLRFLETDLARLVVTSESANSAADGIVALTGYVAAKTPKKAMGVEGRIRRSLERHHQNPDDGLLVELAAELAPLVITPLREAQEGKTPAPLDLDAAKKSVSRIGRSLGFREVYAEEMPATEHLAPSAEQEALTKTYALRKAAYAALSETQIRVFDKWAEGMSGPEIAQSLDMNIKTVYEHQGRIRKKLKREWADSLPAKTI